MSFNLGDLARRLWPQGMIQDQPQYGPASMFTSEQRNPYVPESGLESLGNILGMIGNAGRENRNAQVDSLMRAFNIAQQQGPEAVQAFLNNPNLPDWFKEKVLPGISAGTFQGGVDKEHRQIASEVRQEISRIFQDAATIEDPDQRDRYIDQQIQELEANYPEWARHLFQALPRDAQGHYILPNVNAQARDRQLYQEAFQQVQAIEAEVKGITDPAQRQARYAMLRAEFVKRYPQFANLLPENVDQVAGAAPEVDADIRRKFGLKPDDPIPTVGTWASKNMPKLVQALTDLGLDFILDEPLSQFWDSERHQIDWSKVNEMIQKAQIEAGKTDRSTSTAEGRQLTALRTALQGRIQRAQEDLRLLQDRLKDAFLPDDQKARIQQQIEAKQAEISRLEGDLDKVDQRLANLAAGIGESPTGPTGAGPSTGGTPTARPTQEQVNSALQRFRLTVQSGRDPQTGQQMSREDTVRSLLQGWPGLSPMQKRDFANNAGLNAQEVNWLNGGGQGPYLGPSAKPGTYPNAGPTPAAPGGFTQSEASQSNALNAAHRFRVIVKTHPQMRVRLIQELLLPFWSKLLPQQRAQVANAAGLTRQEADWLTAGGQSISAAPTR